MKSLSKPLLIITLLLCTLSGFSQLSVSYYNSSLSKIGVAYNFNDKLWTELRLYSNTFFEDITPEAAIFLNVIRKEKYNMYVGLGGVVNFYNGIILPVGVQFTPFEKFNNFSLHIECQPTVTFEGDGILQSSWGLRYRFKDRE